MGNPRYRIDYNVEHITTFLCKVHKAGFIPQTVRYKSWQFTIPPGVFRASFSKSLQIYELTLQAIPQPHGDRALDMGCGCGPISVLMASMGWSVVAVDLSAKAIDSAMNNAKMNNISLDVRLGNMFSSIQTEEKFSLITFNIPFFCCNPQRSQQLVEIEKSWFWGEQDLINFFTAAKDYLIPEGKIVIFTSSTADFHPEHLKYLAGKVGFNLVRQVELPNSWLLPAIGDWQETTIHEVLAGCFFAPAA